jgi:hypothetical protein
MRFDSLEGRGEANLEPNAQRHDGEQERRGMKRSQGRFLTTHVGSLVRPSDLLEFAAARREGRPVDEQAYEACLRRSVARVAG